MKKKAVKAVRPRRIIGNSDQRDDVKPAEPLAPQSQPMQLMIVPPESGGLVGIKDLPLSREAILRIREHLRGAQSDDNAIRFHLSEATRHEFSWGQHFDGIKAEMGGLFTAIVESKESGLPWSGRTIRRRMRLYRAIRNHPDRERLLSMRLDLVKAELGIDDNSDDDVTFEIPANIKKAAKIAAKEAEKKALAEGLVRAGMVAAEPTPIPQTPEAARALCAALMPPPRPIPDNIDIRHPVVHLEMPLIAQAPEDRQAGGAESAACRNEKSIKLGYVANRLCNLMAEHPTGFILICKPTAGLEVPATPTKPPVAVLTPPVDVESDAVGMLINLLNVRGERTIGRTKIREAVADAISKLGDKASTQEVVLAAQKVLSDTHLPPVIAPITPPVQRESGSATESSLDDRHFRILTGAPVNDTGVQAALKEASTEALRRAREWAKSRPKDQKARLAALECQLRKREKHQSNSEKPVEPSTPETTSSPSENLATDANGEK